MCLYIDIYSSFSLIWTVWWFVGIQEYLPTPNRNGETVFRRDTKPMRWRRWSWINGPLIPWGAAREAFWKTQSLMVFPKNTHRFLEGKLGLWKYGPSETWSTPRWDNNTDLSISDYHVVFCYRQRWRNPKPPIHKPRERFSYIGFVKTLTFLYFWVSAERAWWLLFCPFSMVISHVIAVFGCFWDISPFLKHGQYKCWNTHPHIDWCAPLRLQHEPVPRHCQDSQNTTGSTSRTVSYESPISQHPTQQDQSKVGVSWRQCSLSVLDVE